MVIVVSILTMFLTRRCISRNRTADCCRTSRPFKIIQTGPSGAIQVVCQVGSFHALEANHGEPWRPKQFLTFSHSSTYSSDGNIYPPISKYQHTSPMPKVSPSKWQHILPSKPGTSSNHQLPRPPRFGHSSKFFNFHCPTIWWAQALLGPSARKACPSTQSDSTDSTAAWKPSMLIRFLRRNRAKPMRRSQSCKLIEIHVNYNIFAFWRLLREQCKNAKNAVNTNIS